MDNQHYIVRAYLDKFIHPNSRTINNHVLYPYAKGLGRQKPRGTKGLGCAESFFTQKLADGTWSNQLDDSFTELEHRFFGSGKRTSGALSKAVYGGVWPTDQNEKLEIAFCMALLRCRSPVQIHNTAMIGDLCANAWLLNMLNTPEALHHFQESGRTVEEARREIDQVRDELLNGELFVGVDDGLEKQQGFSIFQMMDVFISRLLQMRWQLVEAGHDRLFITSDNPVVINVPECRDGQGLIQSKTTEVWFPISYERGFLLDHRNGGDGMTVSSYSQARVLNRRILKWAYRFVYSPLPQDWLEHAARQEGFNPLHGKMRSLQDLCDSSKGDIVSAHDYLRSTEIADVFQTETLR